jgi:hypothetical protein
MRCTVGHTLAGFVIVDNPLRCPAGRIPLDSDPVFVDTGELEVEPLRSVV